MACELRQLYNFIQGCDITGESSYDIWKRIHADEYGDDSEEEFLEFLKSGPIGPSGPVGPVGPTGPVGKLTLRKNSNDKAFVIGLPSSERDSLVYDENVYFQDGKLQLSSIGLGDSTLTYDKNKNAIVIKF